MSHDEIDKLRTTIRRSMLEQNMSARTLSTLSGVGYLTLRRFLNGNNDTTTMRLLRILNAVGLHISEKGTRN